jgi:uncharacterized membrane-anchored protein
MRFEGTAKLDRRTKDLVKRLGKTDIAIVDHEDMDRVSADALVETGVEVVINAAKSISGAYPNVGPLILTRRGVRLIDDVGPEIFELVDEGQYLAVHGDDVLLDGRVIASGERLTVATVEAALEAAEAGLGDRLDDFARNTIEFLEQEKPLLTQDVWLPEIRTQLAGRHVLVVVRGHDFKQDLDALKPYIREVRPALIGVDGGADAIIEAGFEPDVIVGDMDSVSDAALRGGSELVVHAYADGRAPGMERVEALGLEGVVWPVTATSEDLALLLAYESGADLVVAVGSHANLVEYLDKGRKGMASTFLVRLKVGPRLVDAKGVSKLYRAAVRPRELLVLAAAGLAVVTVVFTISAPARTMLQLVVLRLRTWLGL